jgi:hypothetical protein
MIEVMGRRLFVDRDLNLLQCLRSLLAMAMGYVWAMALWYGTRLLKRLPSLHQTDIWGLARVYFKYNVKFVFKSIPCVVQQNVGLVPVCRSAKILAVVSCEL